MIHFKRINELDCDSCSGAGRPKVRADKNGQYILVNDMNEGHYFNKIAVVNIFLVLLGFLYLDFIYLDLNDTESLSKAYYIKFSVSIFYLCISKLPENTKKPIQSVFHFSGAYWAIWTAVASISIANVEISKYVGVILIFGGFGAFCVIDELLNVLELNESDMQIGRVLLSFFLRLFLLLIFISSLYFLIQGSWEWPIKPLSSVL